MSTADQDKQYATHQLWLLDDPHGDFSGALIPMPLPLDATSQWQAVLDAVLTHAVKANPAADLDGLYEVMFWKDAQPELSGLLVRRLSTNIADALPHVTLGRPLGMIAFLTDPDTANKCAVLSLVGVIEPETLAVKPNRILASLATATGEPRTIAPNDDLRVITRAVGHALQLRLDEHMAKIKAEH